MGRDPDTPLPDHLVGEVRRLVRRHGLGGAAILPALDAIQRDQGRISDASLRAAGRELGVRPADLKELALQEGRFTLGSAGAMAVGICVGEGCRGRGALHLTYELDQRRAAGARAARRLRVAAVPCVGACQLGPNVLIEGVRYHGVDAAGLRRILAAVER